MARRSVRVIAGSGGRPGDAAIPRPVTSIMTGAVAIVGIALTAWAATAPGAQRRQIDLVIWFNDPPQPVAAVFAVVNPLLRPVPLVLLGLAFLGWVLLHPVHPRARWEILRATAIALAVAELITQVLKHLANQARPFAVIPGLDPHGYPQQPRGNAYPSAHTALVVALACGLWPWLSWPQRAVAWTLAVLVALNRLYIGAHWPIDVLGGAAIGALSAAIVWLIADRWPIPDHRR